MNKLAKILNEDHNQEGVDTKKFVGDMLCDLEYLSELKLEDSAKMGLSILSTYLEVTMKDLI